MPGNTIGDIEYETGKVLKKGGLSPLMSLTGHGIGRNIHEKPSIFCDGTRGTGEKILPGMVIAIEPMATTGSGKVKKGPDGWTIVSADKTVGVHFEDTVAVTNKDHKVLTRAGKADNIFL
jgi:methionyl aminopeptidase